MAPRLLAERMFGDSPDRSPPFDRYGDTRAGSFSTGSYPHLSLPKHPRSPNAVLAVPVSRCSGVRCLAGPGPHIHSRTQAAPVTPTVAIVWTFSRAAQATPRHAARTVRPAHPAQPGPPYLAGSGRVARTVRPAYPAHPAHPAQPGPPCLAGLGRVARTVYPAP